MRPASISTPSMLRGAKRCTAAKVMTPSLQPMSMHRLPWNHLLSSAYTSQLDSVTKALQRQNTSIYTSAFYAYSSAADFKEGCIRAGIIWCKVLMCSSLYVQGQRLLLQSSCPAMLSLDTEARIIMPGSIHFSFLEAIATHLQPWILHKLGTYSVPIVSVVVAMKENTLLPLYIGLSV